MPQAESTIVAAIAIGIEGVVLGCFCHALSALEYSLA
jgi:hypothetical protein